MEKSSLPDRQRVSSSKLRCLHQSHRYLEHNNGRLFYALVRRLRRLLYVLNVLVKV